MLPFNTQCVTKVDEGVQQQSLTMLTKERSLGIAQELPLNEKTLNNEDSHPYLMLPSDDHD